MSDYVDIKGYEKLYAINREGSVMSYYAKNGRITTTLQGEVKPMLNNKNYYCVCLVKNRVKCPLNIHRLLALQFIPNPLALPITDHINMDKTDNRLENLRWVSDRQSCNNRTSRSDHPLISITPYKNYQVSFIVNGKRKHFGTYKTLDEALSARDCALDCNGLLNYCYGFEPVNDYL